MSEKKLMYLKQQYTKYMCLELFFLYFGQRVYYMKIPYGVQHTIYYTLCRLILSVMFRFYFFIKNI